jgi:hypothetical protein
MLPKNRPLSDFGYNFNKTYPATGRYNNLGQEPSALITKVIKILQDEASIEDLKYKIADAK